MSKAPLGRKAPSPLVRKQQVQVAEAPLDLVPPDPGARAEVTRSPRPRSRGVAGHGLVAQLLTGWRVFLDIMSEPDTRLVAGWFFMTFVILGGLTALYISNAGVGFHISNGCSTKFGNLRLAVLFTVFPLLAICAVTTVAEAMLWLEYRRRGSKFDTKIFWMYGLTGLFFTILTTVLIQC